jgi:hypothetical protein
VSDVTLAGNVTATAGPDTRTGTATPMTNATNCSRVELNLGAGTGTDIQNDSSGTLLGAWNTKNGPLKAHTRHNDWIDASWFFPALTSLVDPKALLVFVGQVNRGGAALYHLCSYGPNSARFGQQLSQKHFYLDPSSFLPIKSLAGAVRAINRADLGETRPTAIQRRVLPLVIRETSTGSASRRSASSHQQPMQPPQGRHAQ